MVPLVNGEQYFWRFLAASDPEADAVIFRDADAKPSRREKEAVDQWLESGLDYHIIRDSPWHQATILAGLWGCRGKVIPDMEKRIKNFVGLQYKLPFGADQKFLDEAIYPEAKHGFIHSEFARYSGEITHPIPSPRERMDWIGKPVYRPRTVKARELNFKKSLEEPQHAHHTDPRLGRR